MFKSKVLISLLGFLFFTSCDSKFCNYNIVSDYNKVGSACATLENCVETAQSFIDTYPDVSCEARTSDPNSIHDKKFLITEEIVRKILISAKNFSKEKT